MMRIIVALIAGLIFGFGLSVSQMINPAKVLAFLDLAGDWDPSLAFVMLGAVPIAGLGYRLARFRPAPLCASNYSGPSQSRIDARLIAGAILFGIGWGLVGYCPGPAIASLGAGNPATLLFVAAMLMGMAAFSGFRALLNSRGRQAV
jgi:uncharacterized membrane protein YedE/YeeE